MADTVPAMLEPGEYVIKKSSAKKIGYKNLNKMNRGGKMPKEKYSSYNEGGEVKKKAPERKAMKSLGRMFTIEGSKLKSRAYIANYGDSFKKAFRSMRNKFGDDAKFEWRGETYTTKLENKMNRGGKMPKAKYQGYKKGGEVDPTLGMSTREYALDTYRKLRTGGNLTKDQSDYAISSSFSAFRKTEDDRIRRKYKLKKKRGKKLDLKKYYKREEGFRDGGKVKYEYYQKGGEVDKTKKPKIESTDERRARIQALKYPFGADWPEVSKANEARAQAEMARYLSKLKPHQRKSVTSSEYYKRQYPKLHEKYHGKKKK